MPAPPPPKKIKRPAMVLDEDEYTEALSRIVKRDFFPGLAETEAQLEFLDAMESRDEAWIRSSTSRLNGIMTPVGAATTSRLTASAGETPRAWNGSTPAAGASDMYEQLANPPLNVDNVRLSTFQAKYVSEDSESFYTLIDKHNVARRERHVWLYNDNKLPSRQQIALRARAERLLEAPKDPARSMELAIRNPEDTRQAMPNVTRSKPLNGLMFIPDATHQVQNRNTDTAVLEDEIAYENGLLPSVLREPNPDISSPSLSAIDAAVRGNPRFEGSEAAFSKGSTPLRSGYAFVDPEPSPSTGDSHFSAGQAMKLLPALDPTPNPFNINKRSRREELGRKMVEDMSAKKRTDARKARQARTPVDAAHATPSFTTAPSAKTPRVMTPAARNLLAKVKTPHVSRRGFGDFGGVKATPEILPAATPRPKSKP